MFFRSWKGVDQSYFLIGLQFLWLPYCGNFHVFVQNWFFFKCEFGATYVARLFCFHSSKRLCKRLVYVLSKSLRPFSASRFWISSKETFKMFMWAYNYSIAEIFKNFHFSQCIWKVQKKCMPFWCTHVWLLKKTKLRLLMCFWICSIENIFISSFSIQLGKQKQHHIVL